MPSSLCNVPSTFTTLINTIFGEEMDDFVIVYIKFILIYSKIAKEHAMHLEVLLQKLSNKEE